MPPPTHSFSCFYVALLCFKFVYLFFYLLRQLFKRMLSFSHYIFIVYLELIHLFL